MVVVFGNYLCLVRMVELRHWGLRSMVWKWECFLFFEVLLVPVLSQKSHVERFPAKQTDENLMSGVPEA